MLALRLQAVCSQASLPPHVQQALGQLLYQAGAAVALPSWVEPTTTLTEDTGPQTEPSHDLVAQAHPQDLGRFEDLGLLGRGGSGEVRRVRDPTLNRVLALKILHVGRVGDLSLLARFRREACLAAQIQHPGVIPIYEFGLLPDGRPYLAMEEVEGTTLGASIQTLYSPGAPPDVHLQERILQALARASEAVAFAHSKGIVHRDIKPGNIMIGQHGQVRVVDWGLSKSLSDTDPTPGADPGQLVHLEAETQLGEVAGTPAYMAPEQATGTSGDLGPWTDVYALGAVLFETLTGRPPLRARTIRDASALLLKGWRDPMSSPLPIPQALREICARALHPSPQVRYPDAGGIATDLHAWLRGAPGRAKADDLVQSATAQLPTVARLRARAAVLTNTQGQAVKAEAHRLRLQADSLEEEALTRLQHALLYEPDHPEALGRLAERARARLAEAEAAGDEVAASCHENDLRRYDRGRHAEVLVGEGTLTLHTEPAGAAVVLQQYTDPSGEATAGELRLGVTPLDAVVLPRGTYHLLLHAPDHAEVSYTLQIGRCEHVDGCPPGQLDPQPIVLPAALAPGERYVPASWTWIGGDPAAIDPLPRRRVWVEGFLLQDLTLATPAATYAEALRLATDAAAQTGLGWRLPTEEEWEKAQATLLTPEVPTDLRCWCQGSVLRGGGHSPSERRPTSRLRTHPDTPHADAVIRLARPFP